MTVAEILDELRPLGSAENVAGMARFGIVTKMALGVPAKDLKEIAKRAKKEAADRHSLALELWDTGIHDARAVAYLTDDPKRVTEEQMESWVRDFDNWAITDGTCGHLFCRSPLAYQKAFEWSERNEEFVKRAGIVLMAWLAVHDKKASDEKIAAFLPVLEEASDDERNFVKKAVNWSLRQLGKRSPRLNRLAIETAETIRLRGTKAARWIASDALRELRSDAVATRLANKDTSNHHG
jgi:3-methyladenine DNA glycosylase AlkD